MHGVQTFTLGFRHTRDNILETNPINADECSVVDTQGFVRIHTQYIFPPSFYSFTNNTTQRYSISGNRYEHRWCYLAFALHSFYFLPPISVKIFKDILICRHHIKVHPRHTENSFLHIGAFSDISRFETKARLPHKPEVSTYPILEALSRQNLAHATIHSVSNFLSCFNRNRTHQ